MKRATTKRERVTQDVPLAEQVDQAVEKIMSDRASKPHRVDSRIAAILNTASQLRDLPSHDFKAKLKEELLVMVTPANISRRPARNRASYIPAGYHTANVCLVVRDAPRAIQFYKAAFGATELSHLDDPSGNLIHAQLKIGDSPIDIAPEQGDYNRSPQSLGGSAVPMELYVEDVDALAERAIAAGAKVIFPVADQFYGDRSGRLQDPFGHIWIVSTHQEDLSSEEISLRAEAWMSERRTAGPQEKPPGPAAGAPQGYHSITPYLQVNGAPRLIEFLKEAFGAEEILRFPRGDQIAHAQLKIEDSMIEVADAIDKYQPNPTAIWLFVKDSDAVYERALKAGATSLRVPTDQDYGDREASVKDPFGNHWYIATHRADAEPLPEGMHAITPYLHPKSAPQVIDFFRRAFGAEEIFRAQDPAGTVHHAKLRIGDSIIAMGEAHGPYQPMPPALHLYVPDTDAAYKRALEAGAVSIDEPVDQNYGDRYAGVKDPFGNVWYVATHLRDFTIPSEPPVQAKASDSEPRRQPASIMPFMHFEDAAAAADFYKKVFDAKELHRDFDQGRTSHIQIDISGTRLMLRDATPTPHLAEYIVKGYARTPHQLGGTPLHLYVYVPDADAAFKRALDSGSEMADPMEDKEWGDRCGGVKDPFGYVWYIATPLRDVQRKDR